MGEYDHCFMMCLLELSIIVVLNNEKYELEFVLVHTETGVNKF